MGEEQLITISIVVLGVLLLIWLGRKLLKTVKKSAESMSEEELGGVIVSNELNNDESLNMNVAKSARYGSGRKKWMAIIIVLLLILDGVLLNFKGLWIIFSSIGELF